MIACLSLWRMIRVNLIRMISFIFPAYNEEENLKRFPSEVFPVFDALRESYEILVIDDGSHDQTFAVASALGPRVRVLRHDVNQGLGAAIQTGFREAKGDLIITMDTDLTFAPSLVARLLARYHKGDVDVVSGSPKLAGYGRDIPSYRVFISHVANLVYRVVMGARVTAVSPIFRLYKREQVVGLPLRAKRFDANAEILFYLIRDKRRIAEIPTELTQRKFGESKLNYKKEMVRHAKLIARLLWMRLRGSTAPQEKNTTLIVTQVLDETDPVLGFFVAWVKHLARDPSRSLLVCCWKKGVLTEMPSNVEVIEMPKGAMRRSYLLARLSWQRHREIKSVFVHMIPPVVVALGWFWRLLHVRIILWYTHGTVSRSLCIASWFVHTIATASNETCRIASVKKHIMGHGIDVDLYRSGTAPRQPIVLAVGRISPRKHQRALIELCDRIRERKPDVRFICRIIGGPRTEEDRAYFAKLRALVKEKQMESIVLFEGPRIGNRVRAAYQTAACYVSVSLTGGWDKVVLEAMASETPVLAVGSVYRHMPGVRCVEKPWTDEDVEFVVRMLSQRTSMVEARDWIKQHANLDILMKRLSALLFS